MESLLNSIFFVKPLESKVLKTFDLSLEGVYFFLFSNRAKCGFS